MWTLYLLTGCGAPPEFELLDHARWQTEGCSTAAMQVEFDAVEIDTTNCSPARLEQPLSRPIAEGDALEIVWWHDFLFVEEPTSGFFRLYLDDQILYEVERPIPGPPLATTEVFEAPVSGGWLTLEVDNHGSNTWDLLRLTAL